MAILPQNPNIGINYNNKKLKEIHLAGGCFWGIQAYIRRLYGVAKTEAGYANGHSKNPTYFDVCYKDTGYAEVVKVSYDPSILPLASLLEEFFKIINPTVKDRQGPDVGNQYRTGIYYVDDEDIYVINDIIKKEQKKYKVPIVTEMKKLSSYHTAEEYHQDYLEKKPSGYCHIDLGLLNRKEK